MTNLPSVTWLISFLVCRWKLRCQIIFLWRKCTLMVFSPYEFDAGRELICCISDKIRASWQGSAVICSNNRNSLINASRTEGIYSNGGHNSSVLLASASSHCLRQVIVDKKKAGISQEADPFAGNTQLCFLYRSTKDRLTRAAERERINRGIH